MSFSVINRSIKPWANPNMGFRPISPPNGCTGLGSGKMHPEDELLWGFFQEKLLHLFDLVMISRSCINLPFRQSLCQLLISVLNSDNLDLSSVMRKPRCFSVAKKIISDRLCIFSVAMPVN